MVGRVWALERGILDALLRDTAAGVISAVQRESRGAIRPPTPGTAVLFVGGLLEYRQSVLSAILGSGTSTAELRGTIRGLGVDKSVERIVLVVDSPGGSVEGIQELAATIRDVRRTKPVTALVDVTAASAAFWVAASATEVIVSPSGSVGSVGVYGAHEDISKAAERAGVKVTLVAAGKFKTEASPFEELGDEAKQEMQRQVDRHYRAFVDDLAMGRMINPAKVERDFGQGRMVPAADAVRLGMADRVATVEQAMQSILVQKGAFLAEMDRRRRIAASRLG
jgi:signal peptide peptidase SppA